MNTMFITQDTDTLQSIIVVVTHFIKFLCYYQEDNHALFLNTYKEV